MIHETHDYVSTACWHAQFEAGTRAAELHAYCKAMIGSQGRKRPAQCKWCEAKCSCECHTRTGNMREAA